MPPASTPSLPLASYAGTYTDQWYGDIQIDEAAGKLSIRFTKTPSLAGTLEHWQHDTFVARWTDRELRADAFVTFALKPDGSIERARMEAVSPATDFSFDFQDLLLVPKSRSSGDRAAQRLRSRWKRCSTCVAIGASTRPTVAMNTTPQ